MAGGFFDKAKELLVGKQEPTAWEPPAEAFEVEFNAKEPPKVAPPKIPAPKLELSEKPWEPPAEAFEVSTPMRSPHEKTRFFQGIAAIESKGQADPYAAMNPNSSAVGKYQFLWSKWGNQIQNFAKRPLTKQEFAKDKELQEKFAEYYHDTVLIPEANKLEQRYGKYLVARGATKPSDARALIHFLGYRNAATWALTGELPDEVQKDNVTVRKYLDTVRKYY
jgi:hypothetical protein